MYRTLWDLLADKLNLASALYFGEFVPSLNKNIVKQRFSDFGVPTLHIYLFGTPNYFFFDIYTYSSL